VTLIAVAASSTMRPQARPMPDSPPPSSSDAARPGERRLESWGEIASYLHRSVSTVQRWEKQEGLPVRRIAHSKLGSVYATMEALDGWVERRSEQAPAVADGAAERLRLVVLPFQNLSGRPEEDYFSEGLTDELITHLARLRPDRLAVIARTSAMRYRYTDVRKVGAELGVGYVLEGSVRRGADRVRVSAQLVSTGDGLHLWADSYEQHLADVLEIQIAIAERVGDSLSIHLLSEQHARHAESRQTTPEARDEYLKGRFFWHKRSREGLASARECFERAIALDPQFAAAHDGLADTYAVLGFWTYGMLPPREAFPRARAAARRALELEPGLAEAYATLGFVQYEFDWDFAGAERSFQRALELNPSYATGRQRYASLLGLLGRSAEALAEIERARALDPLSLLVNHTVAWLHYFARDFDQAREGCRRTLELNPGFPVTHLLLAAIHSLSGRYDDALAEQDAYERLDGPSTIGLMARGCHHARAGEKGLACRYLDRLRDGMAAGTAYAWQVAMVHAALGDADEAFADLDRAVADRSDALAFLKVEPFWDPLRGDPRFAAVLRTVGLA
jgi:TolB-like protein/Tfp pilus assembly protein PilF